jgi:hypothetical protein
MNEKQFGSIKYTDKKNIPQVAECFLVKTAVIPTEIFVHQI